MDRSVSKVGSFYLFLQSLTSTSAILGFVRYKLFVGYSTLVRGLVDRCAASRKFFGMLVITKSSQQLLSMVSCSFHHDQNKRVSIIILTIHSLIDLNNFHSETCFIPNQSNMFRPCVNTVSQYQKHL